MTGASSTSNTATAAACQRPLFYDHRLRCELGERRSTSSCRALGFFTSPAFLANWETNDDNQFRVTTSQTVITALGEIFSPADQTATLRKDGLNDAHTAPGSTCYGCHQFLDPMRLYFAKTLVDQIPSARDADDRHGLVRLRWLQPRRAVTCTALANTLIRITRTLPTAWVQKLCYYANSQACDEKDPEFQRISARPSWPASTTSRRMVGELFASPLGDWCRCEHENLRRTRRIW